MDGGKKDMDPIKAPWNPEEDEMLRKLLKKQGHGNWSVTSKSTAGRSVSSGQKMEKEKENDDDMITMAAKAVGIVAGVGLAAWGISKLVSSPSWEKDEEERDDRKTMKAPGRDFQIYRDDFEKDAKGHFRRYREQRKIEKLAGLKK